MTYTGHNPAVISTCQNVSVVVGKYLKMGVVKCHLCLSVCEDLSLPVLSKPTPGLKSFGNIQDNCLFFMYYLVRWRWYCSYRALVISDIHGGGASYL